MAAPEPVVPVKLLVAALWSREADLERALEEIEKGLGPIDHRGPAHPFEVTGYYREEMGGDLRRSLITIESPVDPGFLPRAKLLTGEIEDHLRDERTGRRTVNLDAGYLDHHKLVLASAKPAGQKVYLGQGIYADLMLRYHRGELEPFAWTFPDFRDGRYHAEILEIRRAYLERLRENSGGSPA